VLIVCAGTVDMAGAGLSAQAHFMVLTAILLVAAVFVPWAVAVALRISVE